MQEPVLFNTTIKKNILFGKQDATDEEVYIAAQKANALQFIESNVEDLTPEQKQQNLDNDLKKAFDDVKGKHSNVAQLYDEFSNSTANIKQLVLDLMNSANDDILSKANLRSQDFAKVIHKCSTKFGSSWSDIVINFEWYDELVKIQKEPLLDQ